jgi:hypothetical protein
MENQTIASPVSKEELLSNETVIIWLVAIELVSLLIVLLNLATILTFVINRHLSGC